MLLNFLKIHFYFILCFTIDQRLKNNAIEIVFCVARNGGNLEDRNNVKIFRKSYMTGISKKPGHEAL